MQSTEAATEGVPVMCMPNLISNLSSKSSMFMLSVGLGDIAFLLSRYDIDKLLRYE